jgi:cytochrome c peroxidase
MVTLPLPRKLALLAASLLVLGGIDLACLSAASQAAPAQQKADYAPIFQRRPKPAELSELGRKLFFDRSLSASGQLACASCHNPSHAYGPANKLAVQLGGENGKLMGTRAAPSLRYLQTVPPFSEHFHDNDGNDSEDAGPTGGLTWDGRARSRHEQAGLPLLGKNEMANASPAAVVAKLARAPYAERFRQVFGSDVFDDDDKAWRAALLALEAFQDQPAEFYPYTSKYDAYLRGQAKLSAQEARGLKLFNDERKGNCASCHISQIGEDGAFPQFTDFGLIALGVPRNHKIAANANPHYYDLGLCGPLRTDFKNNKEYCGLFRTPSLRNVALRNVFFHNGAVDNLKDAVRFYAERDSNPEKWYPRGKTGKVDKFDDLPTRYRQNVNMEAPFGRKRGEGPALSAAEIDDVVAFLRTLTDGYRPTGQSTVKVSAAK